MKTPISLFALFSCVLTILLSLPYESSALGAARNLRGLEFSLAQFKLKHSLSKLATGSGPSYRVVKVYTASKQVVAGTLTKYNADLCNSNNVVKNCSVGIWSRPWLPNGNQVTIACPGEPATVRSYN